MQNPEDKRSSNIVTTNEAKSIEQPASSESRVPLEIDIESFIPSPARSISTFFVAMGIVDSPTIDSVGQ